MTARGLKSTSILGLAFLFLSVSHAEAQTTYRTYVSGGTGNDSNPCTHALPCQTLRAAMTQTRQFGEVVVLDATEDNGLFGLSVTITKSISIISSGGRAGINGLLVVAPEAGGQVLLRGMDVIDGGVSVTTGAGIGLVIDDCTFFNAGIAFLPSGTATSNLQVRNTLITKSPGYGILIQPQSTGPTVAVLDNVNINNSNYGIRAYDYATVTVRNSVMSQEVWSGIDCVSSSGGPVSVLVEHSQTSYSGGGVLAVGSGAILRISDVTITKNNVGINYANGGVVSSFGNNSVTGNAASLPPTLIPLT